MVGIPRLSRRRLEGPSPPRVQRSASGRRRGAVVCSLASTGWLLCPGSATAGNGLLPWPDLTMRLDSMDEFRHRRLLDAWGDDGAPLADAWHRRIERYRGEPPTRQAEIVNRLVNQQIAYADDLGAYGVSDHWALLAETLATGAGDCEDLALAKLESLAYLGWDEADLAIAVGDLQSQDGVRPHAVALVRIDDSGDPMVLGTINPTPVRLSARDDFAPVYVATIAHDGANWLFLRNLMRHQTRQ